MPGCILKWWSMKLVQPGKEKNTSANPCCNAATSAPWACVRWRREWWNLAPQVIYSLNQRSGFTLFPYFMEVEVIYLCSSFPVQLYYFTVSVTPYYIFVSVTPNSTVSFFQWKISSFSIHFKCISIIECNHIKKYNMRKNDKIDDKRMLFFILLHQRPRLNHTTTPHLLHHISILLKNEKCLFHCGWCG